MTVPGVVGSQEWVPRTEDFRERVRDVFAKQRALQLVGATLEEVEPGFVEIHMRRTDEVTQHHGMVHGGVIGMLADTAGALAALTIASAGGVGVTVEYKVNLLAPATDELMVARGHLIRSGRPLSVAHAHVYGVSDEREMLVATSLGTFAGR